MNRAKQKKVGALNKMHTIYRKSLCRIHILQGERMAQHQVISKPKNLIRIIENIRHQHSNSATLDICTLCAARIVYIPENNTKNIELKPIYQKDFSAALIPQNKHYCRFACQHIYHVDCLKRHSLSNCIMCVNADQSNTNRNLAIGCTQIVTKQNLLNLLTNINLLYSQSQLEEYCTKYYSELSEFHNHNEDINLFSSWNIPKTLFEETRKIREFQDDSIANSLSTFGLNKLSLRTSNENNYNLEPKEK